MAVYERESEVRSPCRARRSADNNDAEVLKDGQSYPQTIALIALDIKRRVRRSSSHRFDLCSCGTFKSVEVFSSAQVSLGYLTLLPRSHTTLIVV